jgi:hypothetical protein
VPMGVFGAVAPVLTLGSLSKRWLVPGWRLGWIVTNDPNGVFQRTKVLIYYFSCLNIGYVIISIGKFVCISFNRMCCVLAYLI